MYTITPNVHTRPLKIRATTTTTMESSTKSNTDSYQNILMMRHGDRIDQIEPIWLDTASRPWDPPLSHDGTVRAFRTGQKIRSQIRFPIHRVFVSPFVRCVQTASQVIAALSAVDFDPNDVVSKIDNYNPKISEDQFRLNLEINHLLDYCVDFQVCIEFGLSEMMNTIAIKPEIAPKDLLFDFSISELEALFHQGMVDHNVDSVYKEMPQWGETVERCTDRFLNVVKTLADKYPLENLLLVTHGEGVRTTFATYKGVDVYEIEYCACAELRRHVYSEDGFIKGGDFEVVTSLGQGGIKYISFFGKHRTMKANSGLENRD